MLTTRRWTTALGIGGLIMLAALALVPVGTQVPAPVAAHPAPAAVTPAAPPAGALAATLDLGTVPTAARPTDPQGVPSLVSVGVSPPATGQGATITLTYTISSPTAAQYLLGGSIALAGSGNWLNDTTHDIVVSVPAGVSTVSRLFFISPYTQIGAYDIQWGLWDAPHTVLYDYEQQNSVLTVAAPHLTGVSFSPPVAVPGGTLVFTYTVQSPAAVGYMPGASIAPTGSGTWISDPANDPVVNVLTGTTTFSRIFVIPLGAAAGTYDVAWGLWDASHTVRHDYQQQDGVLTLLNNTPTPTRTVAPTVTPTVCALQFSDVGADSTFYPYVRCLVCRGIAGGYPCGGPGEPCPGSYYRPGNPVTRGQVAKIVSSSANFNDPVPPAAWTFEDVPPDSTFHDWVERIASRGYITGYPCGGPGEPCVGGPARPYYRPNANVTRGQLAKIVSNTARYTETPTTQTFEDAPPGSTFYLYVERIASRGIISGYPCGGVSEPCVAPANRPYFRIANSVTRGQTAKIVGNTFFPSCYTPAVR